MKKKLLVLFLFSIVQSYAQEQYTVYFDTGMDSLTKLSAIEFKSWIEWHKRNKITKIHGYADNVGKTGANSDLSARRANTVAQILKTNAIAIEEAEVKGWGETEINMDKDLNRKVVIYFEKAAEKPDKRKELSRQVLSAKKGSRIVLKNLKFSRNSGKVVPGSSTILQNLAEAMKNNPNLKIDIQGHICCNMDDTKKLGILRAKTVYNYLIGLGIDKSRLSYQNFGSTRPIYPIPEQNGFEAEANRRVEIEIIEN